MDAHLFHQYSDAPESAKQLPYEEWPDEWKRIYFKSYPRLKRIPLKDDFQPLEKPIGEVLQSRKSEREFSQEPLSLDDISRILFHAVAILNRPQSDAQPLWDKTRRPYPSGGARYPIEIYPIVMKAGDDLPAGLYHYNFKEHSLEVLLPGELSADDKQKLFIDRWLDKAAIVFVLTAVFHRTEMKYGKRTYRLVLLEAGHMCQNFYLVVGALGLKGCGFEAFYDNAMSDYLDIAGTGEAPVYCFACGR